MNKGSSTKNWPIFNFKFQISNFGGRKAVGAGLKAASSKLKASKPLNWPPMGTGEHTIENDIYLPPLFST